jgi:elongation factor Ts
MSPTYLSLESVPQDVYNELRDKFSEELKDSGKPQEVIEQILKGKINKALSDVVLLEQAYIRDGAKKVKEILPESFDVQKFIRFSI